VRGRGRDSGGYSPFKPAGQFDRSVGRRSRSKPERAILAASRFNSFDEALGVIIPEYGSGLASRDVEARISELLQFRKRAIITGGLAIGLDLSVAKILSTDLSVGCQPGSVAR
jgi:hypothetical protein